MSNEHKRAATALDEVAEGRADSPLEHDAQAMREMMQAAVDRVVKHIASLPQQPAHDTAGAEALARTLRESLPQAGTPLPDLLELLFERAIPKSYNTASPGYLAYIPGGGLYESAVASYIADAVNRYVGVFAAAPALAQLEANVVAWLGEMIGYPASARGFLTTGGSLANFSGVVTARRALLDEAFLDGTIYVSDQTHHSVLKAALLAGFPEANVRRIDSDKLFRLRVDGLRDAVQTDRRSGQRPFLVVASAGTTNTGAIDPLGEIADFCRDEKLWLHVDASYGGLFAITDEGRRRLDGLARADSVVLDPHKTLFLPYGSGCLLVRDGEALRRAHTVRADYMPPMQDGSEFVDFCEISPELSREFRGLRVWLPLKLHGIAPFRDNLAEKLQLTRWITEQLRALPDVEIVAEPQLSVVAWRLRPEGVGGERLDELNRELMRRINDRKRVYLTGTRLRGQFVIRVCVVSYRTHAQRMQMARDDIVAAIDDLRVAHGLE